MPTSPPVKLVGSAAGPYSFSAFSIDLLEEWQFEAQFRSARALASLVWCSHSTVEIVNGVFLRVKTVVKSMMPNRRSIMSMKYRQRFVALF